MKKVRYLAGVAGVTPVLGLMIPAAAGLAATTHGPAARGKTVSLAHLRHVRPGSFHQNNIGDCKAPRGSESATSHGVTEFMWATEFFSCISRVSGILGGNHTSLLMRTRFYSALHRKVGGDHFNVGKFSARENVTHWAHTDQTSAWSACIAIVTASPSHVRVYGDVCIRDSQIGL